MVCEANMTEHLYKFLSADYAAPYIKKVV